MTQTAATRTMILDLRDALDRAATRLTLDVQNDDGAWTQRSFGNEAALIEYEQKLDRRGVPHRRVGELRDEQEQLDPLDDFNWVGSRHHY
jgi:hypothetical protein